VYNSMPDCIQRMATTNFVSSCLEPSKKRVTLTKGKPVDLLEMSALDALDCEIGGIPSNATDVFGNIAMNGDEYVRCVRCSYGGCDLRVAGCGCTLHSVCDCVFLYESYVPVLRAFVGPLLYADASPRLFTSVMQIASVDRGNNFRFVATLNLQRGDFRFTAAGFCHGRYRGTRRWPAHVGQKFELWPMKPYFNYIRFMSY
jgi:hypothetical protein